HRLGIEPRNATFGTPALCVEWEATWPSAPVRVPGRRGRRPRYVGRSAGSGRSYLRLPLHIRRALLIRLLSALLNPVEKKVHGNMPAKTISAYGASAVQREFGDAAEDNGEGHHGKQEADHRPRDANRRLLVAHCQTELSQHAKQLAVAPQIAPVIALLQP